jgi:hypothetical protein
MQDQQRYQEAVYCLETYGYDVLPSPPGYMVRHRSDDTDRSYARHLDDLVELAELIEWAARRRELVKGAQGKEVLFSPDQH